jgi:hypothetical protein
VPQVGAPVAQVGPEPEEGPGRLAGRPALLEGPFGCRGARRIPGRRLGPAGFRGLALWTSDRARQKPSFVNEKEATDAIVRSTLR